MSTGRVLALLGRGVVPPDTAVLSAADIAALHADGIFETVHVHHGRARRLDEHLARMSAAADRLALDLVGVPGSCRGQDRFAELVGQAVSAWPVEQEGALRLAWPRGGPVFATVSTVSEAIRRLRRDGIRVITAPAPPLPPGPLVGAKALSYAANLVQLRRAKALGADDALWVSAGGNALEGPTSALVWLDGTALCTVPVAGTGILPSTTAAWLSARAGELGFTAESRPVTPSRLVEATGAWLTSSIRGPVAIRELDGVVLRYDGATTARIQRLLGYPGTG